MSLFQKVTLRPCSKVVTLSVLSLVECLPMQPWPLGFALPLLSSCTSLGMCFRFTPGSVIPQAPTFLRVSLHARHSIPEPSAPNAHRLQPFETTRFTSARARTCTATWHTDCPPPSTEFLTRLRHSASPHLLQLHHLFSTLHSSITLLHRHRWHLQPRRDRPSTCFSLAGGSAGRGLLKASPLNNVRALPRVFLLIFWHFRAFEDACEGACKVLARCYHERYHHDRRGA